MVLYVVIFLLAFGVFVRMFNAENGLARKAFLMLFGAMAWGAFWLGLGMHPISLGIMQTVAGHYIAWLPLVIVLSMIHLMLSGYLQDK